MPPDTPPSTAAAPVPERRMGHGRQLSYYDFARSTVYACQADPRFSYCVYVPSDYEEDGTARYRLIVSVHGTLRDMAHYRDTFVEVAERRRAIVLAPLFPAGIASPTDLSGYKMLRWQGVAYDRVLLAMVDEIAARYRLETGRFALHGFSGGGQFANRFLLLHPERLAAVSIGAPGVVTLLDFERDFWVGVRNFAAVFGKPVDLEALRRVRVQTVIGGDDTDTWEITIRPGNAWWMEGADLAGANRLDRLAALGASLQRHGIELRHDTVPSVAHRHAPLVPTIQAFMDEVLEDWKT